MAILRQWFGFSLKGTHYPDHSKLYLLTTSVNFVFVEFCLCEHEVFEFHQGTFQTLIQESTGKTTAELIAHPGLPPMHPRPPPIDVELLCELTDRYLNASVIETRSLR